MSTGTGEDEKGLRQLMDFTRMGSLFILLLHFYYECYGAFQQWALTNALTDRLLGNLVRTGLFKSTLVSKGFALALLLISLVGARGRKTESMKTKGVIVRLVTGLFLFWSSVLFLRLPGAAQTIAGIYMGITGAGFLLILSGAARLSRLLQLQLGEDIFNERNETFPQEERLLQNEASINLPARYHLRGTMRKSWINIINPFRGLLVSGTPGSGKSYFVIQHVIRQHIQKGFAMLVYDFKFDDLSKIAYNTLRKNAHAYKAAPAFYVINFDDLSRSHRCNPLDPLTLYDITDATESSRSILLGLNKEWITRQGNFFVESPINFLTAIIWFLKKYQQGRYCTLPHAIELMQVEYEKLFPVLRTQKEIEVLINPFLSAYKSKAMEQLEGQIASAKIGMARLSSPQLYWIMCGNDFSLDINNPAAPKILCLAGNPQKLQVFGAVLSLYVNRIMKLVNKKGMLKCSLVLDEFPTLFVGGIDSLLATARSNKVATCLGMQDFSQLKKDYGADQAAVIMNIAGNIISGQVNGDTARQLSERIGRIVQVKESVSINRTDTSISKSGHLDFAVPPSKMANLSAGEFVGLVADDPDQPIRLKAFHGKIINDHAGLRREQAAFEEIPVVNAAPEKAVLENYFLVKTDIEALIDKEIETLLNTIG